MTPDEACLVAARAIPAEQRPKITSDPALPTPHFGEGGTVSVVCAANIKASPLKCLEICLDLPSYGVWNTFIVRAAVTSPPSTLPELPPALAHLATAERAATSLLPGSEFEFEVRMSPEAKNTNLAYQTVTRLEAFEQLATADRAARRGYRVAWRSRGMITWFLRLERIHEFADDGHGGTDYVCWETFYGILSRVLQGTVMTQIQGGFVAFVDGMKEFAETGKFAAGGKD